MERSRLLLLTALVLKAISAKERGAADAYAGPNKSFPLYKDGSHLAAAWDLAGHADDPEAVQRKILAFAEANGLMDHLPLSARHAADRRAITKKALVTYDNDTQPVAQTPSAEEIAAAEADPEEADEDPEQEREEETAKTSPAAVVAKAWSTPQGAVIEGWVSTEEVDADADIVTVEAFAGSLPQYAALRMPLSSEHAMKSYPVGHGQRIALVRDGKVLQEATHPSDPAAFEHLPASGTGVFGRFLVTDPTAAKALVQGNVGGFSWVGKAHYQPRPGGQGRIFRRVDPWNEVTIAAYPRNVGATVVATKTL